MKPLRFLFLCAVFFPPDALAQNSSDATMQALMAEVRQLRLALERSAMVAPKLQITLQRLQIQQDVVARISRELDAARNQVAQSAHDQAGLAGEIKHREALAAREQDATRRKDIEVGVVGMKSMLDQRVAGSSELRGDEADLASRLRAEQAKLDDLSERLNVLEKQLEGPLPK